MALYLGDTKLTGTGVQVDEALSSTSTNPVQNKTVTEALSDVGYSEWQKPSDWIDIRSGALANSIYLLVGHSADYTTYPEFSARATISNSGTYDVYVDGIKQATTASGTATTLNWQTLALASGWDVTYPSALRTHVVRFTPSVSSNSITGLKLYTASTVKQGLLWMHATTTSYLDLSASMFDPGGGFQADKLEAITTPSGKLNVSAINYAFANTTSLIEVPTFVFAAGNHSSIDHSFVDTKVRKAKFVNLEESGRGQNGFIRNFDLKNIIVENGYLLASNNKFENTQALEKLPSIKFANSSDLSANKNVNTLLKGCTSLKDTFLDASEGLVLEKLTIGGTASARIDGLKGLVVSNAAPFTGTSPQMDVSYTGLDRGALVNLFNSMPTVTGSQVCNVTGCTGAAELTASDIAIATNKGWTVTR